MPSSFRSHSAPATMRLLCMLLATGCAAKSESAHVIENYTRVPYEGEYIDNDQFYSPPPSMQTNTDMELDP